MTLYKIKHEKLICLCASYLLKLIIKYLNIQCVEKVSNLRDVFIESEVDLIRHSKRSSENIAVVIDSSTTKYLHPTSLSRTNPSSRHSSTNFENKFTPSCFQDSSGSTAHNLTILDSAET